MLGCHLCGTREINDIFFSFEQCGFVCEQCQKEMMLFIKQEQLSFDLCAMQVPVRPSGLNHPPVLKTSAVVDRYVDERLDKKYSKMSFLQEI